jgi:hypothetical protein
MKSNWVRVGNSMGTSRISLDKFYNDLVKVMRINKAPSA